MKKTIKQNKKDKSFLRKFTTIIVILIVSFGLLFCGFGFFIYLNAPEFNTTLLYKQESSNIYDSKGQLIATIGSEKRQIVAYEDLPQVLVDAIIATETIIIIH